LRRHQTFPQASKARPWWSSGRKDPPESGWKPAETHLQEALDGGVQHRLRELSRTDGLREPAVPLEMARGHLQLESRGEAGVPLVHGAPVGDDEAPVAPFGLEDVRQEPTVLGTVGPVELVVGAHHDGGVGFHDRGLEGGQVKFPESPLVHLRIDEVAVGLLVVGGEVLEAAPTPWDCRPST
jgi:hypothetical protein